MISPLSDPIKPSDYDSVYQSILSHFQRDSFEDGLAKRLDIEQMFILINGVLPVEACLYHQILPLFLDGSRLHLGMVSPDDVSSADYVRRIVSYLNYSLVPHQISSESLQAVLSAYLRSCNQSSSPSKPSRPNSSTSQSSRPNSSLPESPTSNSPASNAPVSNAPLSSVSSTPSHSRPSSDSDIPARPRRNRVPSPSDRNTQPTLIVDSPENLNSIDLMGSGFGLEIEPSEPPPQFPFNPSPLQDSSDDASADISHLDVSLSDVPSLETQIPQSLDELATTFHLDASIISDRSSPDELSSDESSSDSASSNLSSVTPPEEHEHADSPFDPPPDEPDDDAHPLSDTAHPQIPSLLSPLPAVDVQVRYLSAPIETLAELPPAELLHELLGRALLGGIGRLYFERQPHQGRILWSQNGVLQSVLDRVRLPIFLGLIGELKRMTKLSLIAVDKPKQIELERMYDNNRILLRFRFMPTDHGEDATIQVLRGAALRFYQQQQLSLLGRDALSIAKQLHTKVNEMRDRAQSDPSLSKAKVESLPALSQLLHSIENQLGELHHLSHHESYNADEGA
ncbi:MAG: hypothetical protein ACFE0I_07205 [Elainellaceae cyanobacterium]